MSGWAVTASAYRFDGQHGRLPIFAVVAKVPGFSYDPYLTDENPTMIRVTSTEFGKEVGRYQDAALAQPVVVTRNRRDRTVMISADEYQRLKRRDREVLGIEHFTDAEIEAISRAAPLPGADTFNHELNL